MATPSPLPLPQHSPPSPLPPPSPLFQPTTPPKPTFLPDRPSPTSIFTPHLLPTPAALLSSPHLPALFQLINRTFSASHNSAGRSLLPPKQYSRLRTPAQLADEVGLGGFTWLLLEGGGDEGDADENGEEGGRVVGTASARPWGEKEGKDKGAEVGSVERMVVQNGESDKEKPPHETNYDDASKLFKRQPSTTHESEQHPGMPKWEILVTVVAPELQGRGLAALLAEKTEGEIRRRVKVERAARAGRAKGVDEGERGEGGERVEGDRGAVNWNEQGKDKEDGKIMLLLSTMQELNEHYYAKRGWVTTGVQRFGPGTMGSRDGFGVVEMGRVIEG